MRGIAFYDLADYLRHGREIEFAFNGRQYSITNHSGFWYLCDDTDHILLDTLGGFEEKELLVSRVADSSLDGMTIREIFDRQLYHADEVFII